MAEPDATFCRVPEAQVGITVTACENVEPPLLPSPPYRAAERTRVQLVIHQIGIGGVFHRARVDLA
ncbi:MAG: hypothetical protein WDN04_21910 [Rhodospirillales bacterium]